MFNHINKIECPNETQWKMKKAEVLPLCRFRNQVPRVYAERLRLPIMPRDCVSRHNGGTAGAPLKPLRVDSALRTLSSLRGLRGAPEVPP